MEMTRRNILRSSSAVTLVAVGAGLGQVTACSNTTTVDPAVIDQINQAIASTCNTAVIVAATTIVAIVIAQFPAAAGVAAISGTVANQIAAFLCGLIPPIPKAGSLSASIKGTEVPVHGFRVVGDKPVWF